MFFIHTMGGRGKHFIYTGGKIVFIHGEVDKHCFMIMIMIGNVSKANILSSEARKPPAGARISGPVGP